MGNATDLNRRPSVLTFALCGAVLVSGYSVAAARLDSRIALPEPKPKVTALPVRAPKPVVTAIAAPSTPKLPRRPAVSTPQRGVLGAQEQQRDLTADTVAAGVQVASLATDRPVPARSVPASAPATGDSSDASATVSVALPRRRPARPLVPIQVALPGKGLRPKPDLEALRVASVDPVNGLQSGRRPRVSRAFRLTDIEDLKAKLNKKGFELGNQVLVRIFKETSEFEVWLEKDGKLELFRNYRICRWSGALGPKLREGDRQSPEGFYAIERWQLRSHSRNHRAIDVGFPNALDRARGLTGSHIQIHGGCGSEGCFAMTHVYVEEIYDLMFAAFRAGQKRIGVHIYPFRLTAENMVRHQSSKWMPFWRTLKPSYNFFKRNKVHTAVKVCGQDYKLGATDPKCVAPWHGQKARVIASRKRALRAPRTATPNVAVRCNLRLPSCRRWLALAKRRAQRGTRLATRAPRGTNSRASRVARR